MSEFDAEELPGEREPAPADGHEHEHERGARAVTSDEKGA